MPKITDPDTLRLLGLPQAKIDITEGGVGAPEAKTREQQYLQNPALYNTIRDLQAAYSLNKVLPTGRFAARTNNFYQEMPRETGQARAAKGKQTPWSAQQIADYQKFLAVANDMLKPIAALYAPDGSVPTAGMMNQPSELERMMTSVPGPEKEMDANNFIIDRAGMRALDKVAQNAFMERWRSAYGSAYKNNKEGKSASQVWREYQQSPMYKTTVATPTTQIFEEYRTGVRQPGKPGQRFAPKKPTVEHIRMLRQDPSLANYFDITYGTGAAKRYLGGR